MDTLPNTILEPEHYAPYQGEEGQWGIREGDTVIYESICEFDKPTATLAAEILNEGLGLDGWCESEDPNASLLEDELIKRGWKNPKDQPPPKPLNWEQYLEQTPVIHQAREKFDDNNFIGFVRTLNKIEEGETLVNPISWHAFEEIGWPEGNRYCRMGSDQYITHMFQKEPNSKKISQRLVARQEKWKHSKKEFIKAHQILTKALQNWTIQPPTTTTP